MDLDGHRRPHTIADHVLDWRTKIWTMPGRMLQDLTARGRGNPLFVSDELPHYATVLAELFHEPGLAGGTDR